MTQFLGGGPQTNPYIPNRLAGMRIQTSIFGKSVPIVYGAQRVAANLIWYGDFTAQNAQAQAGGKGILGGGGKGNQNYIYYAAIAALLCEGPIIGIGNVWDTQGLLIAESNTEQYTVPPGGGTHTTTPPNGGNHYGDLGVGRGDAYSVVANDYGNPSGSQTLTGTQQTPLAPVSSSPAVGQYALAVNAGPPVTASYTFSAADAGKTVTITYVYVIPENVGGGKGSPPDKLSLTLFTGARPQSPWSYLTSKHPGQDLGYTGTAYVANPSLYLGPSGELPGLTFEILGFLPFGGGIPDCNPRDIVVDLLTNTGYGLGWSSSLLDLAGTIANFSDYCVANGFFLSAVYDSQETTASILDRLTQITNSKIVWSGNVLKIVTYGDTTAVGNGATFTPNTSPIYDFDDDDYIAAQDADPVQASITAEADRNNDVKVEFLDRGNAYNAAPVEEKDDAAISLYGVRPADSLAFHEITSQTVASAVANIQLQREVYICNTYEFTVGICFIAVEPMDMVTLTDSNLGLNKTPVRIISVEEDEEGNLKMTAEEFPWGTATATLYPKQIPANNAPNSGAPPESINPPIIFEANNRATGQLGQQLWFGVSGTVPAWGGCHVWMSTDNVNFKRITDINGRDKIASASRMGVLAADFSVDTQPQGAYAASIHSTGTTLVCTLGSGSWPMHAGEVVLINVTIGASVISQYFPVASVSGATLTVNGVFSTGTASGIVDHALEVDLGESGGELANASSSDLAEFHTLFIVDNEIMGYMNANLVIGNLYQLSAIDRALMTSTQAAHVAGDPFLRIDETTFKWAYDASMIGQTLFFKFTSFNVQQQQEQGLADATSYSITILGNYLGLLTPAHTSYRPLSNPLSAIDAGSSTTIDVAAFTMQIAGQDISDASGAITGLAYHSLYYVYYDDPNFFGGAVTYHATLIKETAIAVAGRLFVGSILTPKAGAPETFGNNDGGSGAQIGQIQPCYMSTTQVIGVAGNGNIVDQSNSNDGDLTTFAQLQCTGNSASNGIELNMMGVPGLAAGRFTNVTLKILAEVNVNSLVGGAGTDVAFLSYNYPGGTGTLMTATAGGGTVPLQVFEAALPTDANYSDPTQFFCAAILSVPSTITSGVLELRVYEAWIEFEE